MKNDNHSTDDTSNDANHSGNEQNGDEKEPVEVSGESPQPSSAIILVPRAHLTPHPQNRKIFDPASPEKQAALLEDMSVNGQINPLAITGPNCASGPNVILAGEERYEASRELGWTHLSCRVIDNLTAEQEIMAMVAHNRADLKTRGYNDEALFRMEEADREARRKQGSRQGQRNDLKPGCPTGRLDQSVAKDGHVTTNATRKREKIFKSLVSTPELKQARNNDQIARNPAGEIVYDVERELQDRGLDLNDPLVQQEAQREVNRRFEQHVANKRVGRPKKNDKITPASKQIRERDAHPVVLDSPQARKLT